MKTLKKTVKILSVLLLSLVLLNYVLTVLTWPSKAKLCRNVQDYLSIDECLKMENAVGIVQRAFPEGEVTSGDVNGALGEYLFAAYPTTYGHREVYHLDVSLINYLFDNFATYKFKYDNNGVLIAFSYDD